MALGISLRKEPLSAVYSSVLQRAVQTAQEVAIRHNLNVSRDTRLNEINLGAWDGMTRKEIAATYPELLQAWESDPRSVQPPNGESIADLEQRVLAAIQEIALAYPREIVCMIGHKMTNGIIRCHYLGVPLAEALGGVAEHAVCEVVELPHPLWG